MPCRDYASDWGVDKNSVRKLKARADVLAADLCRKRKLILELAALISPAKLTKDQLSAINSAAVDQVAHRKQDRLMAMAVARDAIEEASNKIRDIRALGGIPKASLKRAKQQAVSCYLALKASDPMTTDLY